MWHRKLFGIVLIILFSLNIVSAALSDNQLYYYKFDGNVLDATPNNNDGVNTGTTNTTGKIVYGRNFDGSNPDKVVTPDFTGTTDYESETLNFWIKRGSTGVREFFWVDEGSFDTGLQFRGTGDNFLEARIKTGSTATGTTSLADTNWHMITVVMKTTEFDVYIDGSFEMNGSIGAGAGITDVQKFGEVIGSTTLSFSGDMDEPGYWTKELTPSDISFLYASGTPTTDQQYPYTLIPSITFENVTIEDVSNFNNSFYNSTPVLLEVELSTENTNNNTNVTFFMYNSTGSLIETTQFITNNLTGSHNISFPYEDTFKFFLFAETNETNATDPFTGNYTISYDISPPIVNNNIQAEYDSYTISGFNSSCSNIDGGSCNITLNNQTVDLNTTSFTFTQNGNITYNITAVDGAGNTVTESGVILVNPLQTFRFNDEVLSFLVSDFTFGGIASNGTIVQIPVYNSILSLGNNTLLFEKFGYVSENFTISINLTSDLNQTFNVTPTTLTIQVFDSTAITTQLTFNLTIQNGSNNQVFINQVNFSKRFNETLSGPINLIIDSEGYSQGFFFNTLNPTSSVSIQAFLTPVNDSDTIRFFVADSAQASVGLGGVLIELQKLINGSYTTIQQGLTGSSGESFIQTDASESFLFIFSKDGFVSATAQSIPGVLDYSVTLSSTAVVFTYVDDISFAFTPSETVLDSNQSLNFTGFISGTGFTFTQFNIYNSTNVLIFQQNSTNPTGTTFIQEIFLTNTTTELRTELVYIVDGITKTASKTYEILSIGGFIKVAQDYSEDSTFGAKFIRFLVIMILVVSALAVSRTDEMQEISLFVIPVFVFLSYISFIAWTQAAALSVLAIVFYIGGKK